MRLALPLLAALHLLGAVARGDAPRSEPWPLLPRPIASFGAVACGGWVYVHGGHAGDVHHHSADMGSRGAAT